MQKFCWRSSISPVETLPIFKDVNRKEAFLDSRISCCFLLSSPPWFIWLSFFFSYSCCYSCTTFLDRRLWILKKKRDLDHLPSIQLFSLNFTSYSRRQEAVKSSYKSLTREVKENVACKAKKSERDTTGDNKEKPYCPLWQNRLSMSFFNWSSVVCWCCSLFLCNGHLIFPSFYFLFYYYCIFRLPHKSFLFDL